MPKCEKKYKNYARMVLKEKGLDEEDTITLAEVARSLSESYSLTYHAVALDIDGTTKVGNDEDISEDLLESISIF